MTSALRLPVRRNDAEVVGFLFPRPIAIQVAAIFGRRSFHVEVTGFDRRRYGIRPDPVKSLPQP